VKYHTRQLCFLGIQADLLASVHHLYQENTSEKWDTSRYTMRERNITILYHAIEKTVANIINATYARRMMGRLDVIPSNIQQLSFILIGCIFNGMV